MFQQAALRCRSHPGPSTETIQPRLQRGWPPVCAAHGPREVPPLCAPDRRGLEAGRQSGACTHELGSLTNVRHTESSVRADIRELPLRVIRVGFAMSALGPIYPQQQTISAPVGTSYLGQSRTSPIEQPSAHLVRLLFCLYSMTSLARVRSVGRMVHPSAFAGLPLEAVPVLKLKSARLKRLALWRQVEG